MVSMRGWQYAWLLGGVILPAAIFANDDWAELLMPYSVDLNTQVIIDEQNEEASVDHQLIRVEQEILILKAEFAYQTQRFEALKGYIEQLNQMEILPQFKDRVARLHIFLTQKEPLLTHEVLTGQASHLVVSALEPLKYPREGGEEIVLAVLLPLSGDYESAGNQLLEGITEALEQAEFTGSLLVMDTQRYANAFEIWQELRGYRPQFVFGPLQKSMAEQWQSLATGIPTLYLNEMNFLNGHERALAPSKVQSVEVLKAFLDNQPSQNILVLAEPNITAQKLESAFYSLWQTLELRGYYQYQEVTQTVGEAIELASNIKHSNARKSWLQSLIQQELVFQPRARKDWDTVVLFLSEHFAIQVASLLEFYGIKDVTQIWLPVQAPNGVFLKNNFSSLSNSYAIFPAYLANQLTSSFQKKDLKFQENEKLGLFYALGQVAVKIVSHAEVSDALNLYWVTDQGVMLSNSVGQFYLVPGMYWIGQNKIEMLSQ